MLRHQLGQHFILGLDLLLQIGDAFLLSRNGWIGPLAETPPRRSQRTPSASGRRLSAAAPLRRTDPRSVSFPANAVSRWLLSLRLCSACVVFSRVPSVILTAEHSLHFQLRRNRIAGGRLPGRTTIYAAAEL